MKLEQLVSIEQMKETLISEIGSPFPIRITKKDDQCIVGFLRGFADQQTNILLISESPETLGLRVLEIKDIRMVEFMTEEKPFGTSRILRAKWFKKIAKF